MKEMDPRSSLQKPNYALNILLLLIVFAGGWLTWLWLSGLVFIVALPVAIFSKSILIKSAAAYALAGAIGSTILFCTAEFVFGH